MITIENLLHTALQDTEEMIHSIERLSFNTKNSTAILEILNDDKSEIEIALANLKSNPGLHLCIDRHLMALLKVDFGEQIIHEDLHSGNHLENKCSDVLKGGVAHE